jgi:ubiquinol-cytochrome c reductase cytochrome c1 subunit
MKKLLLALLFVPAIAVASEAGYRLDRAPIDSRDMLSLQAGARTFVNYCLNCHGAQFMRYNRLTDIGLTEAQIRDNLVLTGVKVGETMKVALTAKRAQRRLALYVPAHFLPRSQIADRLEQRCVSAGGDAACAVDVAR